MATEVLLEDAIDAILDAIVGALEGASGAQDSSSEATGLEAVQAVVLGDRARAMPKLPALWVVPEEAVNDSTTNGLRESWTMPVRLAAIVQGDQPEEARSEAIRIAARARTTVLRNAGRRLGLAYVNDVTSARFDPLARTSERNRNLHWVDATLLVRFHTWENV